MRFCIIGLCLLFMVSCTQSTRDVYLAVNVDQAYAASSPKMRKAVEESSRFTSLFTLYGVDGSKGQSDKMFAWRRPLKLGRNNLTVPVPYGQAQRLFLTVGHTKTGLHRIGSIDARYEHVTIDLGRSGCRITPIKK